MALSIQEKEHWDGSDFIVAVIDKQADLESLLDELHVEGFPKTEIRVFSGETGSQELGHMGGEGFVGWLHRAAEDHAGAAKEFTDRHKAEAASGHHVVIVPLAASDQANDALRVLASHQSHDVLGYVGGSYVTW